MSQEIEEHVVLSLIYRDSPSLDTDYFIGMKCLIPLKSKLCVHVLPVSSKIRLMPCSPKMKCSINSLGETEN